MKNILINSSNRTSGSSSEFYITSNQYIEGKYKVKNISLANSFYIITNTNNTFNINATTLTLTIGSYNLGTLLTAIQTALNTTLGGGLFSISIDGITGKISISGVAIFSLTFSNNFKYLLGYSENSYVGLASYVSENFTNITKLNLGIDIKEASDENSIFNFSNDGISSNIYFKTVSNFGDILSQTFEQLNQYISFNNRTNRLTIKIIDLLTGKSINLNGSDFEILLEKM